MIKKDQDNRLGVAINNALEKELISNEEVGFIHTLVNRFRSDMEKKTLQLQLLSGELNQLRLNEIVIINQLDNMISAAERDTERRLTAAELRNATEVENEEEITIPPTTEDAQ